MSLKGIIALKQRGANVQDSQLTEAFEKLGIKGAIVDCDGHHGVEFQAINEPDSTSSLDWFIGIGVGLLVLIELVKIIF